MDQKQTNTILIFLTVSLFLFTAYPVLLGGYHQGGDLFSVCVIVIASILMTAIYYFISESTNIPIILCNSYRLKRILVIIVGIPIVFFMFIFLGMFLLNILYPDPGTSKEFGIGMIGGIVSGIILIIGDPRNFLKNSEEKVDLPKNK